MTSIKEMLTEERAVSPVVGVALLIAIAVILAAVVGAVVLGIGTSSAETPQASLAFEYNDTAPELVISHDGGESLNGDNIIVRDNSGNEENIGELSAGEQTTIDTNLNLDSGDRVSVVWQDPESDDETVIGSTTL